MGERPHPLPAGVKCLCAAPRLGEPIELLTLGWVGLGFYAALTLTIRE